MCSPETYGAMAKWLLFQSPGVRIAGVEGRGSMRTSPSAGSFMGCMTRQRSSQKERWSTVQVDWEWYMNH